MPWPDCQADFEALVRSMREHGVLCAFGVQLGPPPTAAEKLKAAETRGEDTQQLAEERLRLRREAARDELRLQLAANGRSYSNDELDEMIGPVV